MGESRKSDAVGVGVYDVREALGGYPGGSGIVRGRTLRERMAFQSNGPVSFMMPAFRGVTRRLVLTAAAMFVLEFLLGASSRGTLSLALTPQFALGRQPWEFATYGFLAGDLLGFLLGLFALWTIGAALEEQYGGRWLAEYFFVAAVGGGLLTAVLAKLQLVGLSPFATAEGLWPVLLALLLAYARRNPEAEMSLFLVLRVKAKHLVAVFVLFYLAMAAFSHNTMSAVISLACALCGFLFLKFAPRRGIGFASTEWWYGMRNAYYRSRRRKAAKKFTVYMKKQGKDVSFDESGRYLDPNGIPRDPNDKRWMN